MPSLGQFLDGGDLDNAYADKVIVYVEGEADLGFFNDLAGPDLADRLEFKVPESGSGYHMVKARVGELRPNNPKVHGLLDGEAAASFDFFGDFIASSPVFFSIGNHELEGLIFLTEHELENLVLCHVDVATFLSEHVPFTHLSKKKPAIEIREELRVMARRFYLYALLKFTAGGFHRGGVPCKAVDAHAGVFLTKQSAAAVIRTVIKPKIEATGITWPVFSEALRSMAKSVKDQFDQRGLDPAARAKELLRLADGKQMLKKVRQDYNGSPGWEGQLHGRLLNAEYAEVFRTALIEATGCNDN